MTFLKKLLAGSLLAQLSLPSQAAAEPIHIDVSKMTLVTYRSERELPWNKSPRPNRPMLRIDFFSNVNLPKFASSNGYNLTARAYFCDDPWVRAGKVRVIGVGFVFWQGNMLMEGHESFGSEAPPPYNYYTYVRIEGPLIYDGREEVKEFYNLRQSPRDICLQVRGGKYFGTFESNTVVLSKETIARSLRP